MMFALCLFRALVLKFIWRSDHQSLSESHLPNDVEGRWLHVMVSVSLFQAVNLCTCR
jgi:hypothetical protein